MEYNYTLYTPLHTFSHRSRDEILTLIQRYRLTHYDVFIQQGERNVTQEFF